MTDSSGATATGHVAHLPRPRRGTADDQRQPNRLNLRILAKNPVEARRTDDVVDTSQDDEAPRIRRRQTDVHASGSLEPATDGLRSRVGTDVDRQPSTCSSTGPSG